jgi:hypothetical protein
VKTMRKSKKREKRRGEFRTQFNPRRGRRVSLPRGRHVLATFFRRA